MGFLYFRVASKKGAREHLGAGLGSSGIWAGVGLGSRSDDLGAATGITWEIKVSGLVNEIIWTRAVLSLPRPSPPLMSSFLPILREAYFLPTLRCKSTKSFLESHHHPLLTDLT
jgi:hypothetical protein